MGYFAVTKVLSDRRCIPRLKEMAIRHVQQDIMRTKKANMSMAGKDPYVRKLSGSYHSAGRDKSTGGAICNVAQGVFVACRDAN